jgi:hypothetical protein
LSHSTSQVSVTNSLPSGMVACKVRFLIARRSVETLIGPSGKKALTACSSV